MKKIATGVFLVVFMSAVMTTDGVMAQGDQAPVDGSQLMTNQERNAYQERLRKANTEQERKQIRNENQLRMQKRARERGAVLPSDEPSEKRYRSYQGRQNPRNKGGGSKRIGGGSRGSR